MIGGIALSIVFLLLIILLLIICTRRPPKETKSDLSNYDSSQVPIVNQSVKNIKDGCVTPYFAAETPEKNQMGKVEFLLQEGINVF